MRRVTDERGVVAVITAVLVLALVAMAAFVVDLAAVYQERRELQNGADAAALAVAEDCALGLAACADAAATAKTYADANAGDEVSDAELTLTSDRATVVTTTRAANGEPFLSFLFGPVLGIGTGDSQARATAVWGSPSSLGTFPLVISTCEWDNATAGGSSYASSPYAMPDQTLTFHEGNPSEECAAQAGMDADDDGKLPAGFGWLEADGECQVQTTTVGDDSWVSKAPGAAPPNGCDDLLEDALGTTIPIPVFADFCRYPQDEACPDHDNTDKYRLARYAAFYLTGYNLGSQQYRRADGTYRASPPDCGTTSQSARCVTGFFTTDSVTIGDVGGADGGVVVITLIE